MVMKLWFIVSILLLSIFSIGCEKTEITDNLDVYDNIVYHDSRIIFSNQSHNYYETDYSLSYFLSIYATIAVPNDVYIIDYGHCWIDYSGSPKISDNKTSFGPTNLKNFTITSTFNFDYLLDNNFYGKFYYRAYIITDKGIIYDTWTRHWW